MDGAVEIREGNLFRPLHDGELFSLVIFNAPLHDRPAQSSFEMAINDPRYGTLGSFLTEVHRHLVPEGNVLLAFSTVGDVEHAEKLMTAAGLSYRIKRSVGTDLEYLVYELWDGDQN